jgi:hypothetical protein
MAVNIPIGHKILQRFPFQGPPNFTKIGIFCLKIKPSGNLAFGERPFTASSIPSYVNENVTMIDLA